MPLPSIEELLAEAELLEREAEEKSRLAKVARSFAAKLRDEENRRGAHSPSTLDTANRVRDLAKAVLATPDRPRLEGLPLTSDADSTTLQDVSAIGSQQLARGLAKSKSKKHPFVRALYEHPDPKKRITVAQWAVAHKLKPGTVATWYARGEGKRRIPLTVAQKIELELGIPATLAVWKNGINTDE